MFKTPLLPLIIALIGGSRQAQACGRHPRWDRRGESKLSPRQASDESSAANSTDPSYECLWYSYQPVLDIKGNYPAQYTIATIQANDTEAQSVFAGINATLNSKLPNDVPHGSPTTGPVGVSYSATDPDCWWSYNLCTTPDSSTGVPADITILPEPMTWGLAFDDGPNCSHNALYDYLQEQELTATLFYIGSYMFDWPLQALRGITDGHEICVHTWSHKYMTALSNEEAFAELWYSRKAIKDLLGVTTQCWRPPYGDVDNRIRTIAQALNLTTIIWSYDTFDWEEGTNGVTSATVDSNYQGIIDRALNGTFATHGPVVLNHELTNFTMSEFIKFAPAIKSAFQAVVPFATALNISQPYADSDITFPIFADRNSKSSTTTNGTTGSGSGAGDGSASPSGSSASGQASTAAQSGTKAKSAASPLRDRAGYGVLLLVITLLIIGTWA
ncbi:Chitin deacetylase [Saitozyma sp. JCM 24511]|nr:Chitin deacetylase [Saitozyma sp. JCM 24511]